MKRQLLDEATIRNIDGISSVFDKFIGLVRIRPYW